MGSRKMVRLLTSAATIAKHALRLKHAEESVRIRHEMSFCFWVTETGGGAHGLGWANSQSMTRGENSEDEENVGMWLPPLMVHNSTAAPGGQVV